MKIASNRCLDVLVFLWGVGLKVSLPLVKPADTSRERDSGARPRCDTRTDI
ncbi:hypothetical protein C9890_0391 [Perkinsus sp. BL_2016]|nr:hypothetical protein C9890_0646 [Perkinsus sp. BL_2016]TEB18393.1 hypothetical protein C9890_0391 [Perkinsus sp. BL_2016]